MMSLEWSLNFYGLCRFPFLLFIHPFFIAWCLLTWLIQSWTEFMVSRLIWAYFYSCESNFSALAWYTAFILLMPRYPMVTLTELIACSAQAHCALGRHLFENRARCAPGPCTLRARNCHTYASIFVLVLVLFFLFVFWAHWLIIFVLCLQACYIYSLECVVDRLPDLLVGLLLGHFGITSALGFWGTY